MIILSALSLFAVFLYFHMGIFIYKAKKDSKLNRLFLYWCLSMSAWSFGYAFVYITTESQYIWIKVSAVGWCFFGAFALHLVLMLAESNFIKKPVLTTCLYLPGIVFWCLSIFIFHSEKNLSGRAEDFYFIGNYIYNSILLLLSIIVLFQWGYRSKSSLRNKRQAKILIYSGICAFSLALVTQIILPLLGIDFIPLLAHLYALIVLSGIYYAVRHYILFNVSPQILNDMIFSEIMDLAILLSPNGQILKVSKSAETLLGYHASDLLGKPVHYIIENQSILTEFLTEKVNSSILKYSEVHCLTKTGESLPVSISCLPLTNGILREPEGFVLLGHDIRVTKQLEKQIAEHKITEEQLRQSEERFRDIFYQNTAIMYLIDYDTLEIFDANKAAREYYGYSEDEFSHKKITDINGLSEEAMRLVLKKLNEEKQNVYFFKHRSANGEWRDVEIHTTPLLMMKRKMFISIVTDITERKRAEEQISYLAYHDVLTGLANRKYFYEKLHVELERSIRKGDKTAILFLDLDGFKQVNDNYGHETGDSILQEVANRIKANIRDTDTVARMGGDEFTLLITDINNRSAAEAIAKKILDVLDKPIIIGSNSVHIQASIGISISPDDGADMNQLLNKADNEMYALKRKKRGKR